MFNRSSGVTIIELLIAMMLSALLMTGILQLFLTIKHVFESQQGLARIQENARALDILLSEAISRAGNIGCNQIGQEISLCIHQNVPQLSAVIGLTTQTTLKRLLPDNDILWLTSLGKQYPLARETNGAQGYLIVKGHPNFKRGEMIAVADCSHVDVFSIVEPTIGNKIIIADSSKTVKLSKKYHENAQVGRILSRYYYIGNTKRTNATHYPIYALYQTDLNGRTLELVEGIEHISLSFAVINDVGLIYLPLTSIEDWSKVVSIRAIVLFTSIEDALLKPQAYQLNNQTIVPTDRLMRKWWTYEWPIKNRL